MGHKHHIIPRHEWKVRFGNLQGFDAPDNIVILTVEQHAQAHQFLHELNKKTEDLIAWKGLAGIIGHEDVVLEVCRMNGLNTIGRKRSPETKEKQRLAALKRWGEPGEREAQRARNLGINNPRYGTIDSDEMKLRRSIANRNKPKTEDHKRKIRESQIGVPRPQTTGELNGRFSHGRYTKAV